MLGISLLKHVSKGTPAIYLSFCLLSF